MPELPEVEALAGFLNDRAAGQRIERAEVAALSAMKTYDPPFTALVGRTLEGASRIGKYLCLSTGEFTLVVHFSRGGWLQWRETATAARAKPGKGPLALRVALSGGSGFDITEQGTEKRLALWLVRDPLDVPQVASLGPDPLGGDFSLETFEAILRSTGAQIKGVLTDQSLIAGVGNAYSDEALHAAKLSPFRPANKLTADEVSSLFAAVTAVLRDAVSRSDGLAASGLKSEKKSGLNVHGRTGLPCPVCGDMVREVSFATKSLQYCATCQTGGKPLADRRMSRLLK